MSKQQREIIILDIPKRKRPFRMPTKRENDQTKIIPRHRKHKGDTGEV